MNMFNFTGFSFFGLFGYIVIVLYFVLINNLRQKKIQNFEFSVFIFILYFCFVFFIICLSKSSITFANMLWYIPFLLCIIVEGTIYLIKKYKNSKK